MSSGTNWLDLWGTLLNGLSTSSKSKVMCPKCDNIMVEIHAGHLVCESCGSQITETDLQNYGFECIYILIYTTRLCIGVDMTLELNKETKSKLTAKELKALNDIESGKAKMTRYKNVYDYLKHLKQDSD